MSKTIEIEESKLKEITDDVEKLKAKYKDLNDALKILVARQDARIKEAERLLKEADSYVPVILREEINKFLKVVK